MPPFNPKGIIFMRINKLELISPTQANPIGSLTFEVEMPILYKEGETKPIKESEESQIDISPETQELLQKVAEKLIKDITK